MSKISSYIPCSLSPSLCSTKLLAAEVLTRGRDVLRHVDAEAVLRGPQAQRADRVHGHCHAHASGMCAQRAPRAVCGFLVSFFALSSRRCDVLLRGSSLLQECASLLRPDTAAAVERCVPVAEPGAPKCPPFSPLCACNKNNCDYGSLLINGQTETYTWRWLRTHRALANISALFLHIVQSALNNPFNPVVHKGDDFDFAMLHHDA